MTRFQRILSCTGGCSRLAIVLAVLCGLLGAAPAMSQTPPVIDGNLADMITFVSAIETNGTGCGLSIDDPEKDIAVIDPLIDPCPPVVNNYYVNGFDQNLTLVGLFQGDLYLGIRVAGVVGDPDGNGNADGACGPDTNIPEEPGIGNSDAYRWFLDTNCSQQFSPDVTITVSNNSIQVVGLLYNAAGSSFAFTGNGLEVKLDNVSLPGEPLDLFTARSFTGNTFDGLGEDLSPIHACPPPNLSLLFEKTVTPESICPGTNTTVHLSVTNTSLVILDPVTVKDQLPAGFTYVAGTTVGVGEPSQLGNELTFPNFKLNPGEVKNISFQIHAPNDCAGVVENTASVVARFTDPCLPPPGFLETTGSDNAFITCRPLPCVDQVGGSGPPSACIGDTVHLCGHARNCSTGIETISITVDGTTQVFADVPPGETREFCVDRTMPECTALQQVCFNGSASASNDCAQTNPVPFEICVTCDAEPCVDQVQCSGPPSACVGDPIRLCASARNCSAQVEDLVITVDGSTQTFPAVPAGETREFCVDRTMPECVDGVAHFNASAKAVNKCGETPEAPCQITIACDAEPCVDQVQCSGPPSACVGDPIRLCVSARNCSTAPGTLVLTVDGTSQTFDNVPAGETREFCVDRTMPECVDGVAHFNASAKASNKCGETPETPCQITVACDVEPCVDQVECSGPPSACVGDAIRLCVSARNCSTAPGTLTLTLDGSTQTFDNVPAGETRELCVDRTMPECADGVAHFNATAKASNKCGETPETPCQITVACDAEPCVDQVQCSGPPSACVGDPIRLCVSARNCSNAVGSLVLTVDGTSQTFDNVPAGETRELCVDRTMPECVDGVAHFNASAKAVNKCGETPETPCQITVACDVEPCVDQVQCSGPPSACVGDPIELCVSARNCSTAPATLTLTVDGTSQSFPDVPPGETRDFCVNRTMPECVDGVAHFNASARASNKCGETPETPCQITVACDVEPCVDQVAGRGPTSACVGDPIELCATARNCSSAPATLTITIDGSTQTFTNVPAGETREFCVNRTMPACLPGGTSSFPTIAPGRDRGFGVTSAGGGPVACFDGSAKASNKCGETPEVPFQICVACDAEPCVDQVECSGPPSACVGDPIRLCVSARNCSTAPGTLVLTVDGTSQTFDNVPAGETREFCVDRTMPECVDGVAHFNASAKASNKCGETPETPCQITVACDVEPCVDQVECSGPPSACVGDAIRLCVSARNCSSAPATLTLTVDGSTQTFTDVPAGETREHCVNRTMPECVNGVAHFNASAKASNKCGETPETPCQITVACDVEPCVDQVECSGPPSACVGDPIELCVSARNCSSAPATLTLTVDGSTQTFDNVPAGETREYCVDRTMPACTGASKVFHASARASNKCGETPETPCDITVQCKSEPCVDQVSGGGPEKACPDDPLHLCAKARNCSDGPETIVLTIDGTSKTFDNVAAGQVVEFCVDRVMPACDKAQLTKFDGSAKASNTCGETQEVPFQISVACDDCGPGCWFTGGGTLDANPTSHKPSNFGGNVGPPPSGSWEHVERGPGKTILFNFHSHDVHVIACFNDGTTGPCVPKAEFNVIIFGGTGEYSIGSGGRTEPALFEVRAEDHGEPGNLEHIHGCGTADKYTIRVENAITHQVVFTTSGYLWGGNFQIHPTHGNQAPSNGLLDTPDGVLGMERLLSRSFPNPVLDGSTTISYTIPDRGNRSDVEIAVFDAGGRLIRSLVHEVKDPGSYAVDWDLKDNAGENVASGIYFYRVLASGEKVTQKMMVIRK